MEIASGKEIASYGHPEYNVVCGGFSPDDRWISFHGFPVPGRTQVYIAPFEEGVHNDPDQWILTSGRVHDDKARWSPDGNLIYFHSDRDGFTCLWAQRLDPETKNPEGSAFAIQHFHRLQRSWGAVQLNLRNYDVARDKIVLPLAELSGNVWLMEPPESNN